MTVRRIVALTASLVAAAIILYLGQAYVLSRSRGWGFDTAATNVPLGQYALLLGFTVLGVVIGHLVRELRAQPEYGVRLGPIFRTMLRSRRFLISVFVSPLVYNLVVAAVGDAHVTLVHYLAAIQNGFFWDTVIGIPVDPGPDTEAR